MKKVFLSTLVISMLFGCSCEKQWEEKITVWEAPNWTSDGKIVFLEHYYVQKIKETITGNAQAGGSEKITVYEINNDGSGLKKIKTVKENTFDYGPCLGGISSSSAGDWIVFSIEDWNLGEHYPIMYVIKRDGTNKKEIGSGQYPDFSPDAGKLVYEKPDQGLWIMDRDGTEDHQIVSSGSSPTWSPDGGRIAYISEELFIADTFGNVTDSCGTTRWGADWGHPDSNTIIVCDWSIDKGIIIQLSSGKEDTLSFYSGAGFKWLSSKNLLIGHDVEGWYVININGTNKWYLKP